MPFWIPLLFGLAGTAGAILQANGKKYIDPAWLDREFGSSAFTKQFQEQFNLLQTSQYGQQLINSAMSQGAQVANAIRQNSTNAGFGGAEGVQSGGSVFASSVSDQAPHQMRMMAESALAQQAQKQASDYLQNKMAAITNDQGRMTPWGMVGQGLMGLGSAGMTAYFQGTPATPKTTQTDATQTNATQTNATQTNATQTNATQTNASPTNVSPTNPPPTNDTPAQEKPKQSSINLNRNANNLTNQLASNIKLGRLGQTTPGYTRRVLLG